MAANKNSLTKNFNHERIRRAMAVVNFNGSFKDAYVVLVLNELGIRDPPKSLINSFRGRMVYASRVEKNTK